MKDDKEGNEVFLEGGARGGAVRKRVDAEVLLITNGYLPRDALFSLLLASSPWFFLFLLRSSSLLISCIRFSSFPHSLTPMTQDNVIPLGMQRFRMGAVVKDFEPIDSDVPREKSFVFLEDVQFAFDTDAARFEAGTMAVPFMRDPSHRK